MKRNAEQERLDATASRSADWKGWGPYLSERAWGTVREDYSAGGNAWDYFPHDHARSRAYRWNEDGLGGVCDRSQRTCFALALWNGCDPILKERMFGLTGNEGNHGEDVKEYYFYLDSTPTHSYMKMLYKYPQREYPYQQLVDENRGRAKDVPEYELGDTGVFADSRYFDVFIEYAKAGECDLLIKITAHNRGPKPAELHLLPTLWFRNSWSWSGANPSRPLLRQSGAATITAEHPELLDRYLYCEESPAFLFTENESNAERLWGTPNPTPFVKDAFHAAVVHGKSELVNPLHQGTKAAAWYRRVIPAGGHTELRLRLCEGQLAAPFSDFAPQFATRLAEADEFYDELQPAELTADERSVQRQAFAGLLWTKQWFHYDVERWLQGDPGALPPADERKTGRNAEWRHLYAADVLSMPDKWEYPWFAAWDLAFHCVPLALIDAEFAKRQLTLMVREWYMHPNGQIPAYEWAFSDVNPPVHAWAAWRVYKIDKKNRGGQGDTAFLERIFHKLLINFTWWVNKKDYSGKNVFQGGFLGMDNIGAFDRSSPLPSGGYLEQSDGTSWMGMYCLNLMSIAIELARTNPAYEDVATKFFEHFMYIAWAMNHIGTGTDGGIELWSERDGFFYDVLQTPGQPPHKLRIKSMVGLIPLLAIETIEPEVLAQLKHFGRRMTWFLANRPEMSKLVARWTIRGSGERHLMGLLRGHRMKQVLKRMLNETEFLSPHGIRALSKEHAERPYRFRLGEKEYKVGYEPGDSQSGIFGGNSNWRGPIWMPVNFLLIEALQKFHHYYSDDFLVEYPTGSGQKLTLWDISLELSRRLISLFTRGADGRRPIYGDDPLFQSDPHFRDHVLFHEYFHGDTGKGLGASHQTGWTALIAKLIQQKGEHEQ